MRSIAVINQKGGVGKTTTAVNVSAALAASGQKVLLIDLDPQSHATLHLGLSIADDQRSVYDVLTDGVGLGEVWRPVDDNLWLVGSTIDLAAAELQLAVVENRETILRDKLVDVADRFDYLIVDCPPSLGILTLNALAAVEEVFLPLQPHFLALHGLGRLLETIDLASKQLNERLRLSGVVYCQYDATRLAEEVTKDVARFLKKAALPGASWSGAQIFRTRIRKNVRLAEAPSFGKSIFGYAPSSNGAADYQALAREIRKQKRPETSSLGPRASG